MNGNNASNNHNNNNNTSLTSIHATSINPLPHSPSSSSSDPLSINMNRQNGNHTHHNDTNYIHHINNHSASSNMNQQYSNHMSSTNLHNKILGSSFDSTNTMDPLQSPQSLSFADSQPRISHVSNKSHASQFDDLLDLPSSLSHNQSDLDLTYESSYAHQTNNSCKNHAKQSRIIQPTRSQIPIHCLIEQLDACADFPAYQPTLNDSELFHTTGDSHPVVQQNEHNVSVTHLHQSKLALESITNCNDLRRPTANSTSNTNIAAAASENQNNLSNKNETDILDTDLDHFASDSPISSQTSTIQPNERAHINNMNHSQQASPSTSSARNFQACRETYAIVTSNVLYIDLLRTVLMQLGYSSMDLINAKGELTQQTSLWLIVVHLIALKVHRLFV